MPPGANLPTVAELAVEHGVSVGTADRAVALLAAEALVSVVRGERQPSQMRAKASKNTILVAALRHPQVSRAPGSPLIPFIVAAPCHPRAGLGGYGS
nr:GntR family transcriptional regulator [Micromonospora aurantiaca]